MPMELLEKQREVVRQHGRRLNPTPQCWLLTDQRVFGLGGSQSVWESDVRLGT
jgi:hypothetical protein